MSLSGSQRRQLLARSHDLKARIHVGQAGRSEGAVQLLREALAAADLVKVRLEVDSREEADTIAADLARLVPCELVKRVGFVAILFRTDAALPSAGNGDDRSAAGHDVDIEPPAGSE